jgi:hypothetical protein
MNGQVKVCASISMRMKEKVLRRVNERKASVQADHIDA